MTRNRSSAKQAGTWFAGLVADYLAKHLDDDRIERRPLTGAKDRGDIAAFRVHGQRAVIECKEYGGRFLVGPWLGEAEAERINDEAVVTLVAAKRRGTRDPGDQVVFMTMRDLVSLLTGTRPA